MVYNKFEFDNTLGMVPTLIEPKLYRDERGYFFESFNLDDFRKNVGNDIIFVQDNESLSQKGTIRGMHFQTGPWEQAKLVRVVKGAVYDVAVDIRPDSKTFGKFVGVYLSEDNHQQFFIPRGFAHGFVALEDDTIFQYKCDNYYHKANEGSFRWNSIGIPWDNYVDLNKVIVSEKDADAIPFADYVKRNFNSYFNKIINTNIK
jgi:dTDP-4-dehydrorhamnose 3,5-epimerase